MLADTASVLAVLRSSTSEQQDGAWPVEIKCFQLEVADAVGNMKVCERSLDVTGKPVQQSLSTKFVGIFRVGSCMLNYRKSISRG